jgi:cytochrome c-type biogenesis protein CcmH
MMGSGAGPEPHRSAWSAAVVLAVLLLAAAARAQSLDDRVYAISRQLMCPVCAGQTVAESDATVAREMRAIIRQKLVAGETPDQILRYFVTQFGDGVLAEPPRRGLSVILYLGPMLALAGGLVIAAVFIRRWTHAPSPEPARPATDPHPLDPRDRERLARDLEARGR